MAHAGAAHRDENVASVDAPQAENRSRFSEARQAEQTIESGASGTAHTQNAAENERPASASLRSLFSRFRREDKGKRTDPDPKQIIDNSIELILLLTGRGQDLPGEDVALIMKAKHDFEKSAWSPESAAEVTAAYARLCRRAEPATLASLRYAHGGGSTKKELGLISAAIVLVAVIILLQGLSLRISDIGSRIEAIDRSAEPQAVAAQLQRLGPLVIDWLGWDGATLDPADFNALLADAQGLMVTLDSLVLPGLYGVLGAMAFIMRNHPINMKSATVTPDWTGEYVIRIVLGLVAGVAIGLYLRPESGISDEAFGAGTPIAMSFLAGYAVELLFGIMDRLVTTFSSGSYGSSRPENSAAPPPR